VKLQDETLLLSASDLIGHLGCGHLTSLDLAVAKGQLAKPPVWDDPLLELLVARGEQHEREFVEHLAAHGLTVRQIEGKGIDDDSVARTKQAMLDGVDVIVQAALRENGWVGRADILRRVEVASALGPWSYEVMDTKLARETKAGAVLQLCLYAALLETTQGLRPTFSYVVSPWSGFEPQIYRMDDYAAYYRRVRLALETAVASSAEEIYPEPRDHCEICRWRARCEDRRRTDDHLSLVAGITKVQIDELKGRGVGTLAELASLSFPLPWKPARGSLQSYGRARDQAKIQLAGREAGSVLYELLPIEPGFGLTVLPEPSPGDIFLDLEGDPLAVPGGLEYVFGYQYFDGSGALTYVADWALTLADERKIFERFVDFVTDRLKTYPDLHIYHFAPYEPSALKRLMGRYATRQDEIDSLLRGRRFVDLYSVVRHSFRASVESYSIKKLEPIYGFVRGTSLSIASKALSRVQTALGLGDLSLVDSETRAVVNGYNRDDCESTRVLRDWLEDRRKELIDAGGEVPRPDATDGAPSEDLSEWQKRIAELVSKLTSDVPDDESQRTTEQHARWLLAHCLDWHRREEKATWWEYFRLAALAAEDLLDERVGLAGLEFVASQGGTAKAPIHRYTFPAQESEIRAGDALHRVGGFKFGSVHAISIEDRWVDVKKRGDSIEEHPEAVFEHDVVPGRILAESLVRIAEYVVEHGMEGDGQFLAARDLLMRVGPRIAGEDIQGEGELVVDAACRVALLLEGGIFPIQGPPGSGKTFTGARLICSLVEAGHSVGVCATSHKVIRHLLDEVVKSAEELGQDLHCVQKPKEIEPDLPRLRFVKSNADLFGSVASGVQVAGGTAWLWASADAADSVDVLFVDEAAQMSLANVLAISQAAKRIVMLGDPQQLDQPMQGSHPNGTDVSALHHLLGGTQTIATDRGLFLEETWRLHPEICAFTSEMFYSGRLHSRQDLENQLVRSTGRVAGAGLRFLAVPTHGNQSASPEEADAIKDLFDEILATDTKWVDRHGVERSVERKDILIIAPYNAQVFELSDRIHDARIGTVDKFQGQEAPIVIYSMATSSYADAPRGMEFLYSLNRLNVATSRARCVCILVASPSVFEVSCRTPRQMQLANAFCRYLERASAI
jgi:uncharacterized protein